MNQVQWRNHYTLPQNKDRKGWKGLNVGDVINVQIPGARSPLHENVRIINLDPDGVHVSFRVKGKPVRTHVEYAVLVEAAHEN